jgi:glycosyltransferase involved in cell wall biosynthesis
MGLIAEMKLNRFVTFYRKVFLKVFLSFVDKIVFLGDGEYQLAKKQYPKFSHKFIFLPFCVDYDFWSEDNNSFPIKKEGILFVGNDGKRDYLKLIDIAKVLQDFSFTFVTDNELILESNEIPNNVKIINGSWHDELLTDQELRRIYTEAKITILPLKESYQPSGQSVTLQSICAGTPVLISDTKGFWDKAKFVNNENIIYVNNNSVGGWVDEITKIYNNEELLKNISYKGSKLIKEHFKLEIFDKNLLDLVNKK